MINILYICTHNRCRSILSEAITNHVGQGKIKAYSAGSAPSGEVHPLSLRYLEENGIETDGLYSKSWDELEPEQAGITFDLIVTVCDQAANESCPVWFGKETKLHWGLEDPSKERGSDEHVKQKFQACIDEITDRVEKLLALDCNNPEEFKAQAKALIQQ